MIEFITFEGRTIEIDNQEILAAYRHRFNEFEGVAFVRNLMIMLTEWEVQQGMKFRRISGSDWQQLLLAVR